MKQNLRLGTVAGIPVGAHWSALGTVALIVVILGSSVLPQAVPGLSSALYWLVAVVTGLLFMGSLLLHELAHALVARARNVEVTEITLWILGGSTELREEAKSARTELETAAAGPLASLTVGLLALLLAAVLPQPGLAAAAAFWLAVTNVLLGLFNLLPGAPLDGGRVMHALVWRISGDRARADRAAVRSGSVLGSTLMFLGFAGAFLWSWMGGLVLVATGWFIAGSARAEYVGKAAREGLGGRTVREVMTLTPDLAPAWLDVDELVTTVVLGSRQAVFPVVDFGGAVIGSVSLERLAAVPADSRDATRVLELADVDRPPCVVGPDDPAERLLDRPPQAGRLVAVVEGGRVVGMVTDADLVRILQQALLRTPARAGQAR